MDVERINEFSRNMLPKLLDEQEDAAQSGNELNKILQWASGLGSKAQQALSDLQRSVPFLPGGEDPAAPAGGAAPDISSTIERLEGVAASIRDSNARFDAEFPEQLSEAAAAAASAADDVVATRQEYLKGFVADMEEAEKKMTQEAEKVAGAAAEAAAAAAATVEAAAVKAEAAVEAAVEAVVEAVPEEAVAKVVAAKEAVAEAVSEAVEEAKEAVAAAPAVKEAVAEVAEAAEEAVAAAAAPVSVEIAVRRETSPGQDVWLVGSHPALGVWDLSNALALEWTEGHVWRATIEVDPTQTPTIEYKAVLKCADGPTIWEGGDNKAADLTTGSAAVSLFHEFTE